ncbi:cell division protein ZapA [Solimonas aquatica]|uniref:Cell division protein ZapA n=1 Tax=Solimonas aquatica TaxID=489703 RepID=A0A1H9LGS7_9GAMM|nr:cell division protein ZapA [Solimonas aquatica]SER10123.1 cell division protein ZapA [Solimonas aquatica]
MSKADNPSEPLSVTVRILGKEYAVACPPDEHEALVKSADYLNERMTSIKKRGKALGTERIAVMAALNITRELLELKGVEGVAQDDPQSAARLRQLALDIDSTLSLE